MKTFINEDAIVVRVLNPITVWQKSWCGIIPYGLTVQVTDTQFNPKQGEVIDVNDGGSSPQVEQLNNAITNAAGSADIFMDFTDAAQESTVVLDVSVEASSASDSQDLDENAEIVVYIIDATYTASARFAAAADGVINDEVFDSQDLVIIVSLLNSSQGLSSSDIITLYWGEHVIHGPTLVDNQYATFDLTGREELFQNGTYKYGVTVVDVAGNVSFSDIGVIVVQRNNAAGSNPYLIGVDIPAADANNGYINKVMNDYALVIVEFDTKSTVYNADGEEVAEPFKNATSGTFIAAGYNTNGAVIVTNSFDLSPYIGANYTDDFSINMNDVNHSFFNTIGIGRATFSYNLSIDGVNYSVKKDEIRTYNVNVLGP
ncbi:hypothetical protein [Pantoea sp. BAV 3049]|uniref:hypothetical protein n=1 Tax=Pantoea sp. BAV 3049 TaxID=2654188 RepID=UPI00131D0868|nr:hypothetical protein [Pantoea sp. BAV 3049]